MFIASWNVRTLQDNEKNPERRTAIIARVLKEKNICIAALSETRLAGTGQLEEVIGGYTFYWIGKPTEELRHSGVGFAIRNDIARKLVSLPEGIDDRLMLLRLPTGKNSFATFFSCYAPTLSAEPDAKESFYSKLREQLHRVPVQDQLYVLGDFNARVGADYLIWKNVLGKHGVGKQVQTGSSYSHFAVNSTYS